jgi:lysophospholipase L1-like esterase
VGAKQITSRYGGAITVVTFLVVCGALSVAPVPRWLKPFEISSAQDVKKIASRVFKKPRMTLAEHEEKLAGNGGADGRDAPEGQGIDAEGAPQSVDPAHEAEEKELYATRDARVDVEALKEKADIVEDEPLEKVAPVDRRVHLAKAKAPKAERFREQARSVKAQGAPLENPCIEKRSDGAGESDTCARTALEPFFSTLDALARGDPAARAGVVVLGNSLIASDHVTDVVRARLAERFGDAGRGFLLPDRLSKVAGRRVRTGEATAGWEISTFAQDVPVDGKALGPFGFSGSAHTSTVAGDKTTWKTEGAARARLFYLEHPGQPAMRLEALTESGTTLLGRVEAAGSEAVAKDEVLDVKLPKGAHKLVLTAEGKGATVYGVALEKDAPGIVLDTIGVPAASVRLYVEGTDEEMFVRQIASRDPALAVLMLGGNEVRALDFGTITVPQLRAQMGELITRIKRASPDAACLLVAPIDAAKATAAGEELATRKELATVVNVQREVAHERGCAYFNLFEAMGGAGSLARFKDAGFLSDDLVHPTWKGGDVLGQLFADALLTGWAQTPAGEARVARRKDASAQAPVYAGLMFPTDADDVVVKKAGEKTDAPPPRRALARVFSKLRAIERGEGGRVAVGQFGASHTAGQMFTDRLRARLGERFGVAGRGFVSVGRSSNRLEQGGVVRTLEGAFEIADGREVVLGGAVGMSGTKTRLEPGARFAVQFCAPDAPAKARGKKKPAPAAPPAGCSPLTTPGYVQLAWLYTPDMGTAEIAVDGKTVARIAAEDRNPDSDVQLLRVPIDSESPVLEVAVAAPLSARERAHRKRGEDAEEATAPEGPFGPVHLLSVVEERERTGVVLDAVGLPGTTGMTPQRWRQDLVASEVAARDYDLVVTAWGTNEAGISSLDEATYKHHFEKTLMTLLQASPRADCLIIGATDRLDPKDGGEWRPAPAHELVERVQREVAADHGCAFYSIRTAMGGPSSMKKWVTDGLGHDDHVHFTSEGYQKLADQLVADLFAAFRYDAVLVERAQAESDKATKKAELMTPAERPAARPAERAAEEVIVDRRGG